jgi:hypothetical protein
MNEYLLRKLSEQYEGSITGDKLDKIYRYELSEWEYMVIWAYKIDKVLEEKVKTLNSKMYEELKRKFEWIYSWKAKTRQFKYIQSYLDHLEEVIENLKTYATEEGTPVKIDYSKYEQLSNWETLFYNRLIGKSTEVSAASKEGYMKSLVGAK